MNATELKNFLVELGMEPVSRGHNFMALCPNHSERRPSWGISKSSPHLHGCFACGFSGTLRTLLIDKYNWSLSKIRERLGETTETEGEGLSWREQNLPVKFKGPQPIDPNNLWVFMMTPKGFRYMDEREITRETVKKAGVLFDEKKKRVIFPWFWNKKLVGATGRTILAAEEKAGRKILAYWGLKKGQVLYVPSKKLKKDTTVVLVEGEIDALKVFQSGLRNVAALGHGRFSDQAKSLLVNLPVKDLVLFFDFDRKGEQLTEEVSKKMQGYCKVWSVNYKRFFRVKKRTPRSKLDPGGLDSGAIKILISSADRSVAWPKF